MSHQKLKVFFYYYFKIILLLFKYSCLHLTPSNSLHLSHPHLPPLIPFSLGFVHVAFREAQV